MASKNRSKIEEEMAERLSPFTLSRFNPRQDTARMNSFDFTTSLSDRTTPVGICHCGSSRKAGGTTRLFRWTSGSGRARQEHWCCMFCGCDAEYRLQEAALLREPFPDFETWQQTNGCAQLRASGKSTVWTTFARHWGNVPDDSPYDTTSTHE